MNFKDNVSSKIRMPNSDCIFKSYIINKVEKNDFWKIRDMFANEIVDASSEISSKIYKKFSKR